MNVRYLIALLACLSLSVHLTLADTVVLRNGEKHLGTIANAGQVIQHPQKQREISLLPKAGDDLLRFPVAAVDYVSIDGEPPSIIDFSAFLPGDASVMADAKQWSRTGALRRGLVSMVFGSALLIVGLTVPMGSEDETLPDGTTVSGEKKDALNYIMISGGVVLSAYGVVLLAQPIPRAKGLHFGFQAAREGIKVGVAYN